MINSQKDKTDFGNRKSILIIFLVFALFVFVLFYSYVYKLGYLPMTTTLFFFLTPFLILIHVLNKDKSKLFWPFLLIIFLYVLADKYFRLHIKLSRYFAEIVSIDPVIFVNILYVLFFLVILSFFKEFLLAEIRENPYWLYLFAFAILLKIVSIFSDFLFHDITEDYLELFSLYFFSASFLIKLLDRRRNK